MVNQELVTALQNSVDRGESLQDAIQILVNSGYNAREVQEASNFVGGGVLNLGQPRPDEQLAIPNKKSFFGNLKTKPNLPNRTPQMQQPQPRQSSLQKQSLQELAQIQNPNPQKPYVPVQLTNQPNKSPQSQPQTMKQAPQIQQPYSQNLPQQSQFAQQQSMQNQQTLQSQQQQNKQILQQLTQNQNPNPQGASVSAQLANQINQPQADSQIPQQSQFAQQQSMQNQQTLQSQQQQNKQILQQLTQNQNPNPQGASVSAQLANQINQPKADSQIPQQQEKSKHASKVRSGTLSAELSKIRPPKKSYLREIILLIVLLILIGGLVTTIVFRETIIGWISRF